jgi:tetratricopeptide (TPR) repeat protein
LKVVSRFSRRLLLVSFLAVPAAALAGRYAWAWQHLRAARAELAGYHPEAAVQHLEGWLKVWPDSAEGHLLSSRAARQSGDLDEAARRLHTCQRLRNGTSEEIVLEWALLQAAGGHLGDVEEFLQRQTEQHPECAPLVWEALVQGCIRVYRILDALAFLEHWLRRDPDNLRALELRGEAFQAGRAPRKGVEDLRRVIERDPARTATRWRLAVCLYDMGRHEEALPHLEIVAREKPNDLEVKVRLARCCALLRRGEEAQHLLDAVLAEHPACLPALRAQGQLVLAAGRPAEAETWLRRAVAAAPNDYQANWLLLQALQQQQKTTEARVQMAQTEKVKEQAERLGTLQTSTLSQQPLDPGLHTEMGVLLLKQGHKEVAFGWLQSALRLDASYRPAHAALADYYQAEGDAERAAHHRRQAQ